MPDKRFAKVCSIILIFYTGQPKVVPPDERSLGDMFNFTTPQSH